MISDKFCIESICTKSPDFTYISLVQQSYIDIEQYQGYVGLARPDISFFPVTQFLKSIVDNGDMSDEIISFGFEDFSLTVDVGAQDDSEFADSTNQVVKILMQDQTYFWWSKVTGVQHGYDEAQMKNGKTSSYSFSDIYPAIYDTGTSFIYAPAGQGFQMVQRMVRGLPHYYDYLSGLTIIPCDSSVLYEDV